MGEVEKDKDKEQYVTLKEYSDALRYAENKRAEDLRASDKGCANELRISDNLRIDERHRAFEKTIEGVIGGQKELNRQIEASAKEAISKTEKAVTTSKDEVFQMFKNTDDKIDQLRTAISNLTTRLDVISGKGAGIKDFYGWILAAVLAIIAYLNYRK